MHKHKHSPEKIPGIVSDEDMFLFTENLDPQVKYHFDEGSANQEMIVNGIAYLSYGNYEIPSDKVTDLESLNRTQIAFAIGQKGLLFFGGDDHIAKINKDWESRNLISAYIHPDAKSNIDELVMEISKNLGGTETEMDWYYEPPADRLLDMRDISDVIDTLLYTNPNFENLRKIHEDYMARVKAKAQA